MKNFQLNYSVTHSSLSKLSFTQLTCLSRILKHSILSSIILSSGMAFAVKAPTKLTDSKKTHSEILCRAEINNSSSIGISQNDQVKKLEIKIQKLSSKSKSGKVSLKIDGQNICDDSVSAKGCSLNAESLVYSGDAASLEILVLENSLLNNTSLSLSADMGIENLIDKKDQKQLSIKPFETSLFITGAPGTQGIETQLKCNEVTNVKLLGSDTGLKGSTQTEMTAEELKNLINKSIIQSGDTTFLSLDGSEAKSLNIIKILIAQAYGITNPDSLISNIRLNSDLGLINKNNLIKAASGLAIDQTVLAEMNKDLYIIQSILKSQSKSKKVSLTISSGALLKFNFANSLLNSDSYSADKRPSVSSEVEVGDIAMQGLLDVLNLGQSESADDLMIPRLNILYWQ